MSVPQCHSPGAAPEPVPAGEGAATALLERLAAIEAGIRDDRHRQPAAVVEEIATLWAAGETVPGMAARTGISREIVRDRLRRAGALEFLFRNRHRHVQEVFERRGAGLIASYQAGASIAALAARAGIGHQTLANYLVANGVTLRHERLRARQKLEARGAEMIAAYEAGATLAALGRDAGVTPRTFKTYLAAHGVAIRDPHQRVREILEARGAELIAAYEAGASVAALAGEAGVCSPTLSTFLEARGVRLRHDHGWYRRRRPAGG